MAGFAGKIGVWPLNFIAEEFHFSPSKNAFLLATAPPMSSRSRYAAPHSGPFTPYFVPVIDELLGTPLPDSYAII